MSITPRRAAMAPPGIEEVQFRAIPVDSREDRATKQDKTSLEKSRLQNRREKFSRYEDPGRITEPVSTAGYYAADAERFITDVAGEQKSIRDSKISKKEAFYNQKRNEFLEREEKRWMSMEHQRDVEKQRVEVMSQGVKGTKFSNSVAYNPITLEYDPTHAGEVQQFKDEVQQYRSAVRLEKIRMWKNRDGYNPITGEKLEGGTLPTPPQPPKAR